MSSSDGTSKHISFNPSFSHLTFVQMSTLIKNQATDKTYFANYKYSQVKVPKTIFQHTYISITLSNFRIVNPVTLETTRKLRLIINDTLGDCFTYLSAKYGPKILMEVFTFLE
jgi:hypothetical protein